MYPLLVGKLIYDFYPRSPCGERPKAQTKEPNLTQISIHALLAESDWKAPLWTATATISIHALLAESDGSNESGKDADNNFYPRSPCGERPGKSQSSGAGIAISIHALLAESDPRKNLVNGVCRVISIHALLAESD